MEGNSIQTFLLHILEGEVKRPILSGSMILRIPFYFTHQCPWTCPITVTTQQSYIAFASDKVCQVSEFNHSRNRLKIAHTQKDKHKINLNQNRARQEMFF